MLEALRAHDTGLVELLCGAGGVLVSPGLQGRIFCRIRGELVHRLDVARLERPSCEEFNNLGGNSLWPAPEGGPFAFNYPPGSDAWYVQAGIAEQPACVVGRTDAAAEVAKDIELLNRAGTRLRVRFGRQVEAAPALLHGLPEGLQGVAYRSVDSLTPLEAYPKETALLAAWSLEQFSGVDGVTAFCKAARPHDAVNCDFYGDPRPRLCYENGHFRYALGGDDRQQIGIRLDSGPELIGSFDPTRELLILRRTERRKGVYFNIADNDQPDGPFSASDLYSIFNGGSLGFYELETIAPMQIENGTLGASVLRSETIMLNGPIELLKQHLAGRMGVAL